ncbi:MAG TPA: WXG100 family type VII secretion target [Mycobacteriales bacterium]|nr:WXG100 family type VII secretion target [Mycobacteriales bacterium]
MDVRVSFDALSVGHSEVVAVFKSLTDTLEQLNRDLQPMVSSWTGAAQTAYHEKQSQWNSAADNLATILSQIGTSVRDSHDNYTAAESHNKSLWA